MSATGFFGKLPLAGDFVARGLPPNLRPALDRWLTHNLAAPKIRPEDWHDGIGALLVLVGHPALLCIVPSRDAQGRPYPLAACRVAERIDVTGAQTWCDAVRPSLVEAAAGEAGPDTLLEALARVPFEPGEGQALEPPLLWAGDSAPEPPEQILERMVGGVSSG